MKYKFFTGCLLWCLFLLPARGVTTDFYVNDGVVLVPPQIAPQADATNFVNNNYFSINFTNLVILPSGQITILPTYYSTSNTRNFTNNGVMVANGGFIFDWFDTVPVNDAHKRAGNFVNNGTISAASGLNTNTFFNLFLINLIPPKYYINATNVSLRSSTNIVGVDGLFSLSGKKVDLNRATISMEGFEDNPDSLFGSIGTVGLTAGYWGIGTDVMNPVGNFEIAPPISPVHFVTSFGGGFGFRQLVLPSANFYVRTTIFGTNRIVQAVFLSNTNATIANNVYFPNTSASVVEWIGRATNQVNGLVTTNRMFLTDTYGSFATNFLFTNFSYYTASGTATPANYTFSRFSPFIFGGLGLATPPSSPVGVFSPNQVILNEYAALGARFAPTTVLLTNLPVAARYLTNLPGRIEINAEETLDLRLANITGLNYMSLKATNHVAGVTGAKITVPYSDINLATTNGSLTISNLLYPVVQRFTGEVDLYSGRWTNDAGGFRNFYSVLMVDSKLDSSAVSQVQDLTLRSTNIVIGDIVNVTRNLLIDAEQLTITTNQLPAPTVRGELNLNSTDITWSSSMPRLKYLTNNGSISALNSVFFGGARTAPYYTSNFTEAYEAFINRGNVTTEGTLIWAKYFENTGTFSTGLGFGSITLQSVDTRLTNGSFLALKGDVTISTGNFVATNHVIQAGRSLTLTVTNLLTDTGASNANSWAVGRGFNLPVKPALGDLLGTTITDTSFGTENTHLWAAEDRGGTNSAGFTNNAALGRLILDGRDTSSLFTFTGVSSNNALYVDYLDLRNFATNIDLSGNLTALDVQPNIVIYYAQAVAGNISVAERINHANGDRLRWAFNYAGIYSSTNLVYPDGTTNLFNLALVQSQNIDSDGDGLVNASDPTPILRAQDLGLAVAVTAQPVVGATVSWTTVPNSANTVYYKATSGPGDWQVLTNLSVGPTVSGRVSVFDPVSTNGGRYYRVMMSPPQP
jgi:hypothetical protein